MTNNRLILVGEDHDLIGDKVGEIKLIESNKLEYILLEGFLDYSEEEIRSRIDYYSNFLNPHYEFKFLVSFFKAVKASGSVVRGCDSTPLREEWNKVLVSKGIGSKEEVEVNRKRDLYMASQIVCYNQLGTTLAIVGQSHIFGIKKELERQGIEGEVINPRLYALEF